LVKYGNVQVSIADNKTQPKEKNIEIIQKTKNTEQILNILLPPIKFLNDEKQKCFQFITTNPGKILDLV
jgi:hypothetical protein